METRIYASLVHWYDLLDPLDDHREDADAFLACFARASGPVQTLLELGSGAGNNAYWLRKTGLACTLSDISDEMLERSRARNPQCEHISGDMRTLRLGQTFDAVLIHDAITYMTTLADVEAAVRTAFEHTRPGGVAVFAPDCTTESFRECTQVHQSDVGERSLRAVEWTWDPDPADGCAVTDYVLVMRASGKVTTHHEQHLFGLFSREDWIEVIRRAGFVPETVPRDLGDDPVPYTDEMFLGLRPA